MCVEKVTFVLTVVADHETIPLDTSPVTLMVSRCVSLVTRTLRPTVWKKYSSRPNLQQKLPSRHHRSRLHNEALLPL